MDTRNPSRTMLDIPSRVRVHVETLLAAQNDMGVCDAFEQYAPVGKPDAMNAPHPPKVAGIDSTVPSPAHTVAPAPAATGTPPSPSPNTRNTPETAPNAPGALLQDRLAYWVSDLTTLHELTERLARTDALDEALQELLRAGAALVGARRGLVVLEPGDGLGPHTTIGLGLARSDLGHIETVPRGAMSYGQILDGVPGGEGGEIVHPDLFAEDALDPRHREVAVRLGYAASYALPLASDAAAVSGPPCGCTTSPPSRSSGSATSSACTPGTPPSTSPASWKSSARARAWRPSPRSCCRPGSPRVAGVQQLAALHRTGPRGGGDWYDALPLPDAALGLAVGSVTGSGPSAVAAMGLRASLRAYAVMEGEDPVAVLSDLELLLRLTEPARSATALFAYCEPALRKITLAGAGHSPPLLVGERRTEFVETSVSAPLGMLACWEAPSVELEAEVSETVLLYTDGLLHRTGDPMDRAFARLHAAAASVPRALREDPAQIADHVLRTVLPDGLDTADSDEDVVLLAARFE